MQQFVIGKHNYAVDQLKMGIKLAETNAMLLGALNSHPVVALEAQELGFWSKHGSYNWRSNLGYSRQYESHGLSTSWFKAGEKFSNHGREELFLETRFVTEGMKLVKNCQHFIKMYDRRSMKLFKCRIWR